LRLGVAGAHNLFNATMALAVCVKCGIEPQQAADALAGLPAPRQAVPTCSRGTSPS
jgi:UDP-N-acetylmuramate-alanine ligase